jgi:xanthine dehydrogenase YagR molybdenum-binding subunit
VVSDKTGIPLDKIGVELGDTDLPPRPTSGGSSATATALPAIAEATDQAVNALLKVAAQTPGSPFDKPDRETLRMTGGRVHIQGQSPESGIYFADILKRRRFSGLDRRASTTAAPEEKQYSMHSFGAHFCEVSYDPAVARLRVSRWLTVIDGGRIIDRKTGETRSWARW